MVDWLSYIAHPAVKQYFTTPTSTCGIAPNNHKCITVVEGWFHNPPEDVMQWHPVPLHTNFLTVDSYVLPGKAFDQIVVPNVNRTLQTSSLSILLVGHAFYEWPQPKYGFEPPWNPGAYPCPAGDTTCAQMGGFRYNMWRYAVLTATNPRILGLTWFGYGSPPYSGGGGIVGLSDPSMATYRSDAVSYNAQLRNYCELTIETWSAVAEPQPSLCLSPRGRQMVRLTVWSGCEADPDLA